MKYLFLSIGLLLCCFGNDARAQRDTITIDLSHLAVSQFSQNYDGHDGSGSSGTRTLFNFKESQLFYFDSIVHWSDTVGYFNTIYGASRYCAIATMDTVSQSLRTLSLSVGSKGQPSTGNSLTVILTLTRGTLTGQGSQLSFTASGHDLDSPYASIYTHHYTQLVHASYYYEINNGLPIQSDSATVKVSFTKHNPLSTRPTMQGSSPLVVYPNPVSGVLHCRCSTDQRMTQCTLTDLLGRIARSKEAAPGEQLVEFDCSDLPRGLYRLRFGGAVQSVIVQH